MARRLLRTLPVAVLAAALAACSGSSGSAGRPADPQRPATTTPPASAPVSGLPGLRVDRVAATGFAVPWGLARLPDGDLLLAERGGRVVRVAPDGTRTDLGTVPGVQARGEGGLLGLAVTPGDPTTLYAYCTTGSDNRVLRIPLTGARLGTAQVLLQGIPSGTVHNGGRLVVGPDGALWIGTGDAGRRDAAQDRTSLGGKILRIATDGSIPPDDPFPGSPVWSLGHRNVQGLAFDSRGRLWATEFGQNTWDELNLVTRGSNYGWPVVEGPGERAGFVAPAAAWRTDQASPSGLAIVGDVAYVAALRGRRLWQVPLTTNGAGTPVARFTDAYGRLRTVEPDGTGGLWVTTSNRDGRGAPASDDDRLLHIALGETGG